MWDMRVPGHGCCYWRYNMIKTQKELLTVERKAVRDNIKGAISRAASIEGYIRNCEYYLKHGDWCDDFYGEYQEKRVRWKKVV